MPSSKFVLVVTTNNDSNTTAGEIAPTTSIPGQTNTTGAGSWATVDDIGAFLQQENLGRGVNIVYYDTAIAATGAYTATGQPSNNDTASVNGQTITAVTGTPTANQFKIGATQAATMVNFAAAINASTSTSIVGVLTASASGSVVTITALVPGAIGNKVTITSSLTNITAGAATLTGGSQSHVVNSIQAGI